jgi:hypothetical protein
MIVRDKLSSRFSNRCFAKQDHPFQIRLFDAPHQSLSVSALIIVEPQPPVAKLFTKNTVLLPQVIDYVQLT